MNRARARYNPSQGKQVTRILTSAEIWSDFPGPKTGSAGTMSIRVTPYKPCGARPRAATATFLLCIMCLQNGTAGLAAKGTYPASARTLATPRACRLGLGKKECWQAAQQSCSTHPRFLAFQLEGACVQQRLLERQELLVVCECCRCPASARTLATPRACRLAGVVGMLAGRAPLLHHAFHSFSLSVEGACVQQRLLNGSMLLTAQPVPVPLPPLVLVGCVWVGGHGGLPYSALAPLPPSCLRLSA